MNDQTEGTTARRVPPEKNRGGEWVQLGDELYRIPPLAFRAVIELQDEVEALATMGPKPTPGQMDTVARIVHSALSRNYPSMSQVDVEELLDIGNFQQVLTAVLSIGGFKKEAGSSGPGETPASTGAQLTAH